jgi:hypothetical protein
LRQHVGHFNARDFCHAHSAEGFLVTDRGQTSSGLPHRFVAAIANPKTLCPMMNCQAVEPIRRGCQDAL